MKALFAVMALTFSGFAMAEGTDAPMGVTGQLVFLGDGWRHAGQSDQGH